MQSPPPQPAAEAGMIASPAMGSMPAEAAAEVGLPSVAKAPHAAEAAPADAGSRAELDDPAARQPHACSESSNLTAEGSKQPHAGLSRTADSSSAPGPAGVADCAAAPSEALGCSQTVEAAADANGPDMNDQNPYAPMRHYWGQVPLTNANADVCIAVICAATVFARQPQ